ncbi:hypothetical protein VSX61_12040 [Brenneria populi subsp. brevivirga]|uniref:hypothetical protein n=1 Tax=Brenneria populi TaxID=1505588 RepID=UPI002E19131E|nr:hypothetical protein [Brenneria populi subsp. brevivirga]
MSERYEFLPGCFLNVSISSGYFTVHLQGDLPSQVPSSVLTGYVNSVLRQIEKYFRLSDVQRKGIAEYLSSQGMEH